MGTLDILRKPLLLDGMDQKGQKRRLDLHLDRARVGSMIEVLELLGDEEQIRSLEQLGIRNGAQGRVNAKAPLGGPVLLDVGGSSVAIAKTVAKKIRVKVL